MHNPFPFYKTMFSKLVLCLHPDEIIHCFSMVWFSKSTYLLTSSIFYIFSRGLFSRRWRHLRIICMLQFSASLLQYMKKHCFEIIFIERSWTSTLIGSLLFGLSLTIYNSEFGFKHRCIDKNIHNFSDISKLSSQFPFIIYISNNFSWKKKLSLYTMSTEHSKYANYTNLQYFWTKNFRIRQFLIWNEKLYCL